MVALGADGGCLVDVVPGGRSSEDVVDGLSLLNEPAGAGFRDVILVRAGGACEAGGLDGENVGAEGAEPHGKAGREKERS